MEHESGKRTPKAFSRRVGYPSFLSDATRGVVRSVDSFDLERCGIQGLVMNTFHLMRDRGEYQ